MSVLSRRLFGYRAVVRHLRTKGPHSSAFAGVGPHLSPAADAQRAPATSQPWMGTTAPLSEPKTDREA